MKSYYLFVLIVLIFGNHLAAQEYNIVIKGGHVIDAKNNIDAVMDVAIKDGKIAKVAKTIETKQAVQVVDAQGFYVTPGIIDIHAHVFAGTVPDHYLANSFKEYIVGFKVAHYEEASWIPVDRAVEAGELAGGIPVIVDFGGDDSHPPLSIEKLFFDHLRPGDIYTHVYTELDRRDPIVDTKSRQLKPFVKKARERGIIFDVGYGGASFDYGQAIPATKAGLYPTTISTDLHTGSMNSAMKDMPNLLSTFLTLGMQLPEVVKASTWAPAKAIKLEELGNLSEGSPADVAVFNLRQGDFGFWDRKGKKLIGNQRFECEMTIRDGKIVYDLNGIADPIVVH